MPLPESNIAWPPVNKKISKKLDEWSAWYSGDQDQLLEFYGGGQVGPSNRDSQFRGGVVGAVARWFWGQPTRRGSETHKLHVPIAADLASASSDLLFAEQPTIVTTEGEKAKRQRLDVILQENSWESLLPESGELSAGLGGVYLRVTWDDSLAKAPIITSMHADAAWPEFRFGRLEAVTFWQVLKKDDRKVIRHLERHEKGYVEHGLYVGTGDQLGERVPLTEHKATAGLVVDELSRIATGTARLTAVYVPNIRPNRLWRSDPIGAHLGRADISGVEPSMDALDETYTSWMRDVRIAKGRVIVPQHMLESRGRGQGATFDLDQQVFVGLNMPPSDDGKAGLTVQQFAIRATEHKATIEDLLQRIVAGAGYSAQTFGMDDDGAAATATEIAARERKTMTTREKKTRYWAPQLVAILQAAMDVDQAKFSGPGSFAALKVEFPAAVQPTQIELATTAAALKAAQAASTKTLVKLVHPDWDDTQVDHEVALILDETAIKVPDLPPFPVDNGSGSSSSSE